MTEIPKPASPLPWSIEEITDLGDVISRGFRDANGKGVNRGEEFELFEQPTAAFIVWACNNATRLYEALEKLHDGLAYANGNGAELDELESFAAKELEAAKEPQ